jgi:hypothetical protein
MIQCVLVERSSGCHPRRSEFLRFPDEIEVNPPVGFEEHMVMDNYGETAGAGFNQPRTLAT